MENGTRRNTGALVMFACWYLVQGVIAAFLFTAMLNRLYEQGMSKGEAGMLLASGSFMWGLKVFFGPLVDRFRSKFPWACVTSMIIAALVLLLPLLEGAAFAVILVVVAIPNIVMALQDVTVDGLAIQVLNEKDRGTAQTVMKVAAYFGTLLGGAGVMFVTDRIPWMMVCIFVAILVIAAGMLMPLMLRRSVVQREAGNGFTSSPEAKPTFKGLWQMFKSPGIYAALSLALLSSLAQGMTEPIFFPWWKACGLTKDEIAFVFAGAPWFQIGGALLGGVLLAKLSRKRAMEVAIFFVCIGYLLVPLSGLLASSIPVIGLSWGTGMVDGLWKVVLFTVLMDASDRRFPATSFAVFMAATNLSTSWTNLVGGFMGEHVPTMWFFFIAGMAQFAVLVPLKFMRLRS